MMTQTSLNLVTRELVPKARRMAITGKRRVVWSVESSWDFTLSDVVALNWKVI